MTGDLGLPEDMSGSVKRQLRADYLRVGVCRYEDHGNGYRRLPPNPTAEEIGYAGKLNPDLLEDADV